MHLLTLPSLVPTVLSVRQCYGRELVLKLSASYLEIMDLYKVFWIKGGVSEMRVLPSLYLLS
jgi:hypothetical protein